MHFRSALLCSFPFVIEIFEVGSEVQLGLHGVDGTADDPPVAHVENPLGIALQVGIVSHHHNCDSLLLIEFQQKVHQPNGVGLQIRQEMEA
jgi:hypothetical protein